MAPRKETASSSSSKPPQRSSAARQNESSAARKKRKAASPPPLSATAPPAPTTVYVLIKSEGSAPDGFHSYQPPTNSIKGVYYSKDQAYAAVIQKIISEYEPLGEEGELRKIATTKELPVKQRMERIRATNLRMYEADESRFRVKKSRLFPTGIVDDGKLLDGLKRKKPMYSDFDYQSDGAASSASSDWDIAY